MSNHYDDDRSNAGVSDVSSCGGGRGGAPPSDASSSVPSSRRFGFDDRGCDKENGTTGGRYEPVLENLKAKLARNQLRRASGRSKNV